MVKADRSVYQVRKRSSDGRGAARVDKEGDLNVSFPRPPNPASKTHPPPTTNETENDDAEFGDTVQEPDEPVHEERHEAWRFLLAGGIAGAGPPF